MKTLLLMLGVPAFALGILSFKTPAKPVNSANSLVFPVAGKSNIGSFWGDARDGGRRKHEGIDIFAKKGTDVVAICDGVVVSAGNGGIGGKTVWLQADDHAWTAYYAHLDRQFVSEGQEVKKGDVIGTVGNTGNAKHTPAHLHFGIYGLAGARDPLPLVKNAIRTTGRPLTRPVEVSTEEQPDVVIVTPVLKPESKAWRSVFPEKYVCKQLFLDGADPQSEIFVTTGSNVIEVNQGEVKIIGKFQKLAGKRHPYQVKLADGRKMWLSKNGEVVSNNGRHLGTVTYKK